MAQVLIIGLVFFLMPQKFSVPYAAELVIIFSVLISVWVSTLFYRPLHSKVSAIKPPTQKILFAILVIITAGILYGTVSGL